MPVLKGRAAQRGRDDKKAIVLLILPGSGRQGQITRDRQA
jgi:hypothetical protein